MTRKMEREQAFTLIFEKCFRDDSCDDILELAASLREFEITDYIEAVFRGVFNNLEEIDSIIASHLQKWSIERIAKTNLALLRLAVYEIKFCSDIPDSVTVNEIVELAKTYSDEKDFAYINGVLGAIIRDGGEN